MKLSQQIICAIDDAVAGKFDAGLLHACIALDATSKRLYPSERQVGIRYKQTIRDYYWLIEPMMVGGINLVETVFANIEIPKVTNPDFADVVYHILRCSHAHGDEVPPEFSVIGTQGSFDAEWVFAKGEIHPPDRIIWALLSVSVFTRANRNEASSGDYYLSLGSETFPLKSWWGREDDFRPIANRYNQTRVKIEGLDRLISAVDNAAPGA